MAEAAITVPAWAKESDMIQLYFKLKPEGDGEYITFIPINDDKTSWKSKSVTDDGSTTTTWELHYLGWYEKKGFGIRRTYTPTKMWVLFDSNEETNKQFVQMKKNIESGTLKGDTIKGESQVTEFVEGKRAAFFLEDTTKFTRMKVDV